jgi:hypothetical protein
MGVLVAVTTGIGVRVGVLVGAAVGVATTGSVSLALWASSEKTRLGP